MVRKSDRVRVSELAVVGFGIVSFELEKRVKINVIKIDGSTNVIPYDTVLCILRGPLEAAGFGRANAPPVGSMSRMSNSNSSSSSWLFPVPCRSVFPCSRRCSSALMAARRERKRGTFSCLQRDSLTAVAFLELTSTIESCFARTSVTC
jgi:hypothetical protein